ncbi:MAG: MucB/RseB C-terminal domain-containing protein [Succinivibrionaceae bacterium]|nr:MucB/RseB C-terminal domain-containing protein [Succinivibrionaceae bacterium]
MTLHCRAAIPALGVAASLFLGAAAASECDDVLGSLRDHYEESNMEQRVVAWGGDFLEPFRMVHKHDQGHSYSFWEYLNGEVRGYALRDDQGLDFNREQNDIGPLNWHPTGLYDKIMGNRAPLRDYTCIIAGRTRQMGNRSTVLRLSPTDGLRYGFMIALNDETILPIELSVLDPSGMPVAKVTVIESRTNADKRFPLKEDAFESYLSSTAREEARPTQVWPELNIPAPFSLLAEGDYPEGGEHCSYQDFSDGLVVFRVYRNDTSEVNYPMVKNGSLTVYRKSNRRHEYAVVGEIPLDLSARILVQI